MLQIAMTFTAFMQEDLGTLAGPVHLRVRTPCTAPTARERSARFLLGMERYSRAGWRIASAPANERRSRAERTGVLRPFPTGGSLSVSDAGRSCRKFAAYYMRALRPSSSRAVRIVANTSSRAL